MTVFIDVSNVYNDFRRAFCAQPMRATDGQFHPRQLAELIVSRGPSYEEWALEETRVIEGERGAYRSCAPITNIQVPATVQAIIAARIDRLPEQHKRLLQSASVIGKDVPFVLLQAISG